MNFGVRLSLLMKPVIKLTVYMKVCSLKRNRSSFLFI